MALYGSNSEYALHCLLYLVRLPEGRALSARDVASCQGVSPSLVAKLFTKLEKAKIVRAQEGVRGGFALARRADEVTMLDVVDAVEGRKKLFDCKEIRASCVLFDGSPPTWATRGLCDIHAAMLQAESAMRVELANLTLAQLAESVAAKMPATFVAEAAAWFGARAAGRTGRKPVEGVKP